MKRRYKRLHAFKAALTRGISHFPGAIIYCGIALALVMLALCALVLFQSRQDAFDHSRETSRNVALIAERDIERNFEIYALSLQAVVDSRQKPEILALPLRLQRAFLFDRALNAKYLSAIAVLDASGNLILDNRGGLQHTGNFADRDYFRIQRDNPNVGLYISHPYLSRVHLGEPTIALSRRINNPDGSFAGVALVALDLEYFRDLFAGLSLGPNGAIALIQADGTMLMRVPYDPKAIGISMQHTSNFARFAAAEHGSFIGTAAIDGVRRLYVFDWVPGLPMILNVGVADRDIYMVWVRRTLVIGSLMLVFGLAFIGLSMLFAVQFKQRISAENELRRLARTDGLTGLVNRRTLDEILGLEWRRAHRSRRTLSVLFIDIDHFKAYNDTYGHQLGDATLIAVGHCIAANIRRPGDLVARYGGEEFVVVLPDTPQDSALMLAARIRTAVADMGLPHTQSEHRVVTVSLGQAQWEGDNFPDTAALLKAADDALYEAKSAGRNRAAAYTPPLNEAVAQG